MAAWTIYIAVDSCERSCADLESKGRACLVERAVTPCPPDAACDFYMPLFGWHKSKALNMGAVGRYQMISHKGKRDRRNHGSVCAPLPTWLPYFSVERPVSTVSSQVAALRGVVHHGPIEMQGPMWPALAQNPQGARFALVGAQR